MVSGKVLHSLFFRSFFLQSTWNFERMQNLGFCYAILPVLKFLYKDEDKLKEAIKRHLEFFNTHPYMAAAILGAVARLEEERKSGSISIDHINSVKTGVMGSYGAIGDSFFWGTLKPFASLIGVMFAAFNQLSAPFIFLLIYNVPHLRMRIFGIYEGYREGINIFETIKRFNFTEVAKKIKILSVVLIGVLLAVIVELKLSLVFQGGTLLNATGALSLFLFFFLAAKRGVSPHMIIYISLIVTVGSSALM